jgi:hypothetical protein
MTARRNRVLGVAAIGFASATTYNSVVAIRENVPGEPLGIRVPLSVLTGIAVGWGSAVAAPWPMPAAAVLAATRRSDRERARGLALLCTALGIGGIVGILIEPNTYNRKTWTPAIYRAVLMHVGTCIAMAGAGIWCLRDSPAPDRQRASPRARRRSTRSSRAPM